MSVPSPGRIIISIRAISIIRIVVGKGGTEADLDISVSKTYGTKTEDGLRNQWQRETFLGKELVDKDSRGIKSDIDLELQENIVEGANARLKNLSIG